MSKRGEVKVIVKGAEVQRKLLEGAKDMYDSVSSTYGPVSGNVAIQKNYGQAVVTHDGVTVARDVFLRDDAQDIGAGLLSQASEKSNQVSGDGTSATVLLGYHMLDKANKRVAAGSNPMKLRRGMEYAANWIKSELDKVAVPVPDDQLAGVATISASDPEVGKLVADTIIKVAGVGISVEEYEGLGIHQEIVDGVYFEKGFELPHFKTDLATDEAVHENASILILEKSAKQNQDIVPIIEMVYKETQHKTLLIIGKVSGQALETCALTNQLGKVKICVVGVPVYGDQELPFLEDIAVMTGGKVVSNNLPSDQVTKDYLGGAAKVVATPTNTTIFGGIGRNEDIAARSDIIREQMKSDKYSAFQKERMEKRLSKLNGKIAIIKVGGATETEIKEMKFRVEDAVHATRAASQEGIIPGGATALARLSKLDITSIPDKLSEDELAGVKVVLDALAEPFKQLMTNAGEDGGYRLSKVLNSQFGYGYDVMNITDEPIELIPNGVIDPVKVIKSVVENASSFASVAITIKTLILIDRQWQLEQVAMNKAAQGIQ